MRRVGVSFGFEVEGDLAECGASWCGVALGGVCTTLSSLVGFSYRALGFGVCATLSYWNGSVWPASDVWKEEEANYAGAAVVRRRIWAIWMNALLTGEPNWSGEVVVLRCCMRLNMSSAVWRM